MRFVFTPMLSSLMVPLMASLPIGDWQFWVASVVALAALWIVINSVVPASLLPWKRTPKGTKASLTISAKRGERRDERREEGRVDDLGNSDSGRDRTRDRTDH